MQELVICGGRAQLKDEKLIHFMQHQAEAFWFSMECFFLITAGEEK
jgi:hypothetical protein